MNEKHLGQHLDTNIFHSTAELKNTFCRDGILGVSFEQIKYKCHSVVPKIYIVLSIFDRRRQFGPAKEPEHLLLDYQSHQTRLMPRLATSLGLIFAIR